MKKINKKYIQIGIIALIIVCTGVAFNHFLANLNHTSSQKIDLGKTMLPILDGFALAYILNPLMKIFEARFKQICKRLKIKESSGLKKRIRGVSIALSLIVFLLIVAELILLIVPQLLDSIQRIITLFPAYVASFNRWSDQFLVKYPQLRELLENYWENITDYSIKEILPRIQVLLSTFSTTLLGSVWSVVVFIFKLIIGIILSVYLLYNKEIHIAQAKKMAYSLFREETANNLINNTRFANNTFGGFITGKIVDSLIIGILCFICTSLMRIPYPLLISVIVGVTNVIPYFGPWLGAIPSAFIVLMINPVKCLWFLIFILILQQIDGNIIGPKILGDSTGLSSFWVIFAITLFGGFWGVPGMFLGVPIFAIIYAAIRTFINTRLERKNMPSSTEFYINSDYHSDPDRKDENNGKQIRFASRTFADVNRENGFTDAGMDIDYYAYYPYSEDDENDDIKKDDISIEVPDTDTPADTDGKE
ncbi:MAG: AI-2E family transporter [Lachnospiraceae bacterium]|nr:AI-2E family transporter [Lachnospiraceae bacterium]